MNKIIAVILAVAAFFLFNGYEVLTYPEIANSIEHPYASSIQAQTGASRELLDEPQQQLYDVIKAALVRHDAEATIRRTSYTNEDLRKVLWCIKQDSPDVFWVDWAAWTFTESTTGMTVVPTYLHDADTLALRKTELETACNDVIALAQEAGAQSDYEKAIFVHDYLIEYIVYDEQAAGGNIHTAYGALVDGVAVCDGYAFAYQLLLQKLGVECLYVEGRMKEGAADNIGHAWNIVNIDGVYGHVDVTWDDMDPEYAESWRYALPLSYSNFLLSDEDIYIDHEQDNPFDLPACEGLNYYGQLGLQAQSSFMEISDAVDQALYDNIKAGKFYIEMQILDDEEFARVTSTYEYAMGYIIESINTRLKNEKAQFKLDTWFSRTTKDSTNVVIFEVRPV